MRASARCPPACLCFFLVFTKTLTASHWFPWVSLFGLISVGGDVVRGCPRPSRWDLFVALARRPCSRLVMLFCSLRLSPPVLFVPVLVPPSLPVPSLPTARKAHVPECAVQGQLEPGDPEGPVQGEAGRSHRRKFFSAVSCCVPAGCCPTRLRPTSSRARFCSDNGARVFETCSRLTL